MAGVFSGQRFDPKKHRQSYCTSIHFMRSRKHRAKDIEAEANAFALCLLIPKELLEREIDKLGGLDLGSDKDMESLCKTFGVSTTAMAVRMNMLDTFGKSYKSRIDKNVLRDQLIALSSESENLPGQKK